jgi:predicted nucleotidyltransferase
MRLSLEQREVIKDLARRHFGPKAEVRLFGSRLNDQARGGDIDLYVETDLTGSALQRAELAFLREVQESLGEQRLDVTTHSRYEVASSFEAYAKEEGVPL